MTVVSAAAIQNARLLPGSNRPAEQRVRRRVRGDAHVPGVRGVRGRVWIVFTVGSADAWSGDARRFRVIGRGLVRSARSGYGR